jgi:hypothetical protein
MGNGGGGGEAVPEGREWHALHRSVLWPDHTAVRAAPRPRLRTGRGSPPATSAPGLGSPCPWPCRKWAHPWTTSAPGLGSPFAFRLHQNLCSLLPPHLRRDRNWARPCCHVGRRRAQTWAHPRPRPRRD